MIILRSFYGWSNKPPPLASKEGAFTKMWSYLECYGLEKSLEPDFGENSAQ